MNQYMVFAHDHSSDSINFIAVANNRESAVHKLMGWLEDNATRYVTEADNDRNSQYWYEIYSDAAFATEAMLTDTTLNSQYHNALEITTNIKEF